MLDSLLHYAIRSVPWCYALCYEALCAPLHDAMLSATWCYALCYMKLRVYTLFYIRLCYLLWGTMLPATRLCSLLRSRSRGNGWLSMAILNDFHLKGEGKRLWLSAREEMIMAFWIKLCSGGGYNIISHGVLLSFWTRPVFSVLRLFGKNSMN